MKEENDIFLCMEIFFSLCMFSSVSMLQTSTRAFNVFNLSSLAFKRILKQIFVFTLPFPKSPFAMQMLGRLIVTQILWQILNLLVFPVEMKIHFFSQIFLMEQFNDSCNENLLYA